MLHARWLPEITIRQGQVKTYVYELSAEERPCPSCGVERQEIGSEKSWQIEYIPGHFERLEHVRKKYACASCESEGENPQIEVAAKAEEHGLRNFNSEAQSLLHGSRQPRSTKHKCRMTTSCLASSLIAGDMPRCQRAVNVPRWTQEDSPYSMLSPEGKG